MTKKIAFTLILLSVLFSCKKHRLKGDRAMLEGNWEWVFSLKNTNNSTPPFTSWTDTIFPSDVSSSYGVTFLKKGKVQLLENDEVKYKYRTVFTTFQSGAYCLISDDPFEFSIDLDNDSDRIMRGCVNSDTLVLFYRHFPLPNLTFANASVSYVDFFKKVY